VPAGRLSHKCDERCDLNLLLSPHGQYQSLLIPSAFPERLRAWVEENTPGIRVLDVEIPPATQGVITITVRATVIPEHVTEPEI
jgi:hypothetical protein